MEFTYKTRGGSGTRGKQNVYFACHENDISFFDIVADDILKLQNCAVYRRENFDEKWEAEELDMRLSQMQLIVIPVTSKFLFSENEARDTELKYAREHKIPILPLMQENGLEDYFNEICGDLQVLNKNDKDMTALPFEKKLETFLRSMLIGDEMAEKIRTAFDAYIFLSYRKKDRKYARELMGLIHKNDFCRDIAIWYDEYLTPGESFNDSIKEAIEKSKLFTLVVTPNLVNETNYVMTEEYPDAVTMQKPILPAEMVKTDKYELGEKYKNIPDTIDGYDASQLTNALTDNLKEIAVAENDNDPTHLFFIGLAYLGGIDVETDYEKAVQLIEKSANAGLPEAIEKLAAMYHSGEGVERDYKKSVFWQEKLVEIYKNIFGKAPDEKNIKTYLESILNVGNYCYDMQEFDKAKGFYNDMLKICGESKYDLQNEEIEAYNGLAKTEHAGWNLNRAKKYYEKTLSLMEKTAKNTDDMKLKKDLAVVYNSFGSLLSDMGNLNDASSYCNKAYKILTEEDKDDSNISRYNIAHIYESLGTIEKTRGDTEKAIQWYEKTLEMIETLAAETLSDEYAHMQIKMYNMIGEMISEPETAKPYYIKALEIAETLYQKANTISELESMVYTYNNLAANAKSFGDFKKAEALRKKSLEMGEKIKNETDTVTAWHNLAVIYGNSGDVALALGRYDEAMENYEKSFEISKQTYEKNKTILTRSDYIIAAQSMGDILKTEGRLKPARDYYETAFSLAKQNVEESATFNTMRELSLCCGRLGDISREMGNISRARRYYNQSLEIDMKKEKISDMPVAKQDVAAMYNCIGHVEMSDGEYIKARECYEMACKRGEELIKELDTVQTCNDLIQSYNNLANALKWTNDVKTAMDYCEKALTLAKKNVKRADTIQTRRDVAACYNTYGDIAGVAGKFELAKKQYLYAADIWNELAQRTGDFKFMQTLAVSYSNCGFVEEKAKNKKRAVMYYEKAEEIYAKMPEDLGILEYICNRAETLYTLATMGKIDRERLEKSLALWRKLADEHPEDKLYAEKCAIITSMLKN